MEKRRHRLPAPALVAAALLATVAAAAAADEPRAADVLGRGTQALSLWSGYGWGHELSGSREDALETETVPVSPRWSIGLTDVFGEGAFYRGNIDLSLEGVFLVNTQPHDGSALGGAAALRYNLLAWDRVVPFVAAGAGMIDLDYDLRTQRDGFNFVIFADVGVQALLTERVALGMGYRLHHISNADIREPNKAVDTSFVLLGVTVFLP